MFEKKIKVFVLYKKEDPERFLTVTLKKEECKEYAVQWILLDHMDHFLKWCELHELDENDLASQHEYWDECISETEKTDYAIAKISYNMRHVAAIMRMFGGCVPLGCSYDTEFEIEEFNKQMDEAVDKING